MKQLNQKINISIQLIILGLLSGFAIYCASLNQDDIFSLLFALICPVLSLGAVWILVKEKHYLAAYLIMFLLFYANNLFVFFHWIFSFDISLSQTPSDFPWLVFFGFIGGVYLLLLIISNLLDKGFIFNPKNFKFDQLILFFALLIYFSHGIEFFVFVVAVEFVAINYKKLASLFLMLAKSLVIPLNFIKALIDDNPVDMQIRHALLLLLSLYVIVLIIAKYFSLNKKV